MYVIGTAGHIDHGKSTLVQALTGTHPDRLKEERDREMTIDLGFAWFDLPDGSPVGIVDVPGHRDFIENMLAGVGGIDAVLFVIAADEGVMPQTREHLSIIDLLHIPGGVIALTKTDLTDDQDWIDLLSEDIRKVVAGTVLQDAPIIPVSAKTGSGILELRNALYVHLTNTNRRQPSGVPRLSIDRVFTIAGFGTVVTGTLLDGPLQVGEEVVLLPGEKKARIRGLQTHKKKEEKVEPGSRTAVNITGIPFDAVHRGMTVTLPGKAVCTRRVDCQVELLQESTHPLRHNQSLKLFIGTSEVIVRARIIGADDISAGASGWVQLESESEFFAVRGDRFIVRRPSPGETIGGGVILNPHPGKRYKRFSPEVISFFEKSMRGDPADRILELLKQTVCLSPAELCTRSNFPQEEITHILHELLAQNKVVTRSVNREGESTVIFTMEAWKDISKKAIQVLDSYFEKNPLRLIMPREEFKKRLLVSPNLSSVLLDILDIEGIIQITGPGIAFPGRVINLSREQSNRVREVLDQFQQSINSPPSVHDIQESLGSELYRYLTDQKELIQLNEDVAYPRREFEIIKRQTIQLLRDKKTLTVAEYRDHFQTSRKYALAVLEYFDQIGITKRNGDSRVLIDDPES